MPRVAAHEEPTGALQVRRALYHRCRRGEAEALATLLYRLADRLYTAASFVAPDEPSAVTAVVLAWEDLLALLVRPHVGGHLQDRAFKLLGDHLGDFAERQTIQRQLRNAQREPEDGLLSLPEQQLAPLVEMIKAYAPQIAANYHERSVSRRRTLRAAGLVPLLLVAGLLWLRQSHQVSATDLQLQCLQQRIERRELIDAVRGCVHDLQDPSGADKLQAQSLQHISLVLEEVGNASGWRESPGLRYVVARVQQENLADELAEVASRYEGAERAELLEAHLVLEEVQNL